MTMDYGIVKDCEIEECTCRTCTVCGCENKPHKWDDRDEGYWCSGCKNACNYG